MADGDLISRTSLLKGIEELKESPWFKRGKLEETDTNVDYNRSLYHIGYLERKEATEIIIDLCIKKEPTVDAELVKHGRWENGFCTHCGEDVASKLDIWTNVQNFIYCPNCGARMDGDSE